MFGPLMFPSGAGSSVQPSSFSTLGDDEDLESVPCLICPKEFLFPDEKEVCLSHLLQEHFIVISDEHLIADLPRYIKFWKERFESSGNFKQYCTTILADAKDKKTGVIHEKQEFYLLSEAEIIDRELREKLQKERLESVLERQRTEREDTTFTHECLYCRQSLGPTRSDFLNHLSSQHNLQLGKPSNLVFVDKLIAIIEQKMNNLQCIYCEKFFKDRNVLKEHMRKKAHKRVNPNNEMYDQFYLINYIEPGKSWKEREKLRRKKTSHSGSTGDDEDDDDDSEGDDNDDWSDWEEELQQPIVCLFCELSLPEWASVLSHMKNQHSFNYEEHTLALDFYEQVKVVNYIRRQVYRNRCIICDGEFPARNELLKHMTTEKHMDMPQRSLWNQPEFYFPTYENDAFLCQIDDKREDEENAEISEAK
ncbi:zinc finger protein 277 [Rhodnius prolixus]|uniref:C2H2-type domain-containing protein n=2 Tax=Rhodnius TaxID=13248 RepID=T1I7J7_RHOPR